MKLPSYMLQEDAIEIIKRALFKVNQEFGSSLLMLDDMDFGMTFDDAILKSQLLSDLVMTMKQKCASFLKKLIVELVERLPNCCSSF